MNLTARYKETPVLLEKIDQEILDMCNCTWPTLRNWLKNFCVEEGPIGIKIGGRWRIYPERLKKFLHQGGRKKFKDK